MVQNAIPERASVASRIAAQTLAKREADYADEVRRLLDAALAVMERQGTSARARVADIVATAGLSNEAFYRHFPSKDALVGALLADGTDRLVRYVAHQMSKESAPERQVRRWVDGVLSQTNQKTAATTLAVVWNGSAVGTEAARHNPAPPLADLLRGPFTELGSTDPVADAQLVAYAVVGTMSDHLWTGTTPSRGEIDQITEFCIRAARR